MSFAPYVTPRPLACSEHELVAAVRQDHDWAFEELYSRYRTPIRHYVQGMVGDLQRAEDIAQEVFISALRRMRCSEQPIAFKPWIYEIAKNACIDEYRRAKRSREVPLVNESEDAEPTLCSRAPMPDEAVQGKQRLDDLRGAFRSLSANHHQVIVMRELEGLSYAQIGERLGMTKPVVESTLFRARRRLGQEYDELVSGRRCEQVQAVIAADGERPLRRLGLRDRRQLARHLAHCQPCRRHARLAGVDESFFKTPSVGRKLAGLLPFPWLWLRRKGKSPRRLAAASRRVTGDPRLQTMMRMTDPGSGVPGLGRALATAAAIVAATAGGGYLAGVGGAHQIPRQLSGSSIAPAAALAAPNRQSATVGVPTRRLGSAGPAAATSGHAGRQTGSGGSRGSGGAPGGRSGAGHPTAGGATQPATGGSATGHSGSGAVSKGLGGPGATVTGLVSKAGGTVAGAVGAVSSTAGSVTKTLGSVTKTAGSLATKVVSTASSTVSSVASGASSTVGSVTKAATSTVGSVTNAASSTVGSVTSGASSTVGSVGSTATSAVNKLTSSLSQDVPSAPASSPSSTSTSATASHVVSGVSKLLP